MMISITTFTTDYILSQALLGGTESAMNTSFKIGGDRQRFEPSASANFLDLMGSVDGA
jgi:hypothetical protein